MYDMFHVPSVMGILSLMSEMKQLKFRDVKKLGTRSVALVGSFPSRAPATLFLDLFSLLSHKLPWGTGVNLVPFCTSSGQGHPTYSTIVS